MGYWKSIENNSSQIHSLHCQDISSHDNEYVQYGYSCLRWEQISTACNVYESRNAKIFFQEKNSLQQRFTHPNYAHVTQGDSLMSWEGGTCLTHWLWWGHINTLRPRRNRRHFADDIFKCIFLNENVLNSIEISLKFIPRGPINNIPSLVQIMAGRRPGDKPLSEPMMVSLLTHICVTRPQWVNDIIT